jgi:hypothetical protein
MLKFMNGHQQAQELADRLRKARQEAWREGFSMTSEEAMEQMFRNGSDRKPNPWYRGPGKTDDSSIIEDSEDSPLVTLS